MANFSEILWAKDTLGLGDSISLKTLRERYILLVKSLHPDVHGQAEDVDKPQELADITRAYHVLISYLENVIVSLNDDDVRKNDPHAYHSYRFHDWMGDKS